jgi:hypothetical protein
MRRKTNKFLTCFSKNGKVTELCYCCDNEEVATMGVVARSKGCDIEVFSLRDDENPVMVEIPNEVESETKTRWKKTVICFETGETFTSIRECSQKHGITYKSLFNALNSGNPRNGKHYTYITT